MESITLAFELLLVSSWMNMMLYMLELILAFYFFYKHPNDRWIHRVIVVSALFFDTVGTLAVCANIWMYLITYAHFPPMMQLWTLPTMIIATIGSNVTEKCFLLYRIWKLSQNRLLVGFLSLIVLTNVVSGLISGIYVAVHPAFAPSLAIPATLVSNCASAAGDILSSVALVWALHRVKSPFRTTRSFIRRLTINIISTGVAVAVVTIVMLILFLLGRSAFNLCFSILGRMYTITVLTNLCTRMKEKHYSPSKQPTSIHWSRSLDLTSIHGDPSAVLHLDDSNASSGLQSMPAPYPQMSMSNDIVSKPSLAPTEPRSILDDKVNITKNPGDDCV
ncbi:hypothetical protein HGRIS_011806 [Hohenbuehelia grisea]|uniref:DUF6534 domain-containing protein n=1 Tax=Hohenbuehelia grisea TaxID=104357 RepID=A0ABR3JX80_9AGAR